MPVNFLDIVTTKKKFYNDTKYTLEIKREIQID
jgi:hypothetical protein